MDRRTNQLLENVREELEASRLCEADDDADAIAYLEKEMTKLGKHGGAWWIPPHSVAVNQSLANTNLFRFSILPTLGLRYAYRKDLDGLVLSPEWRPHLSGKVSIPGLTLPIAKKLVQAVKQTPTLDGIIDAEIEAIEKQHKVKVPKSIVAALKKTAMATAKRRWSAKGSAPKKLYPLDGSKPRKLGSWD